MSDISILRLAIASCAALWFTSTQAQTSTTTTLPLTTIFTPATTCFETVHTGLGNPHLFYGWSDNRYSNPARGTDPYDSACFPSGWTPGIRFSPGVCPSGWLRALSIDNPNGAGTAAACCPAGLKANGAWCVSSLFTPGSVTFVVTTENGKPVYTSTSAVFTDGYDYQGIYVAAVSVVYEGDYSSLLASVTSAATLVVSSTTASSIGSAASSAASAPSSGSGSIAGNTSAVSQEVGGAKEGLSSGEKVAIGVSIPIGVLAIVFGIGLFFWRRKRSHQNEEKSGEPRKDDMFHKAELPDGPNRAKPHELGDQQILEMDGSVGYSVPPVEMEGSNVYNAANVNAHRT